MEADFHRRDRPPASGFLKRCRATALQKSAQADARRGAPMEADFHRRIPLHGVQAVISVEAEASGRMPLLWERVVHRGLQEPL